MSKGNVALVDDEDYENISKYSWSYHGAGYAARGYHKDGKLIILKMHQQIIGNVPDGYEIDHINGNKLDNRRCNLRTISHQENVFNTKKRVLQNPGIRPSKYKGVNWRDERHKWVSRITLNGKRFYLGLYETEEEAAIAYNKAALQLFGDCARLNSV